MNIKINKEGIKKFAASITLAAIVSMPVGLAIGCKKTDHTKELCPVTKLLNMLPNYKNAELDYEIPRGAEHQLTHLAEDYYSEEYGVDTNEYSKGENGITTYYSDGTKESLVFEKNDISKPEPDFQLKQVIKPSR